MNSAVGLSNSYLDCKTDSTVVASIIHPKLDYCNSVILQNSAIAMIGFKIYCYNHALLTLQKKVHKIMETISLQSKILDFNAHCCHMGTAIKHPVLDPVKPSFVIFDILAL